MRKWIGAGILLLAAAAGAEEETAPAPPWTHKLVGGVTVTQVAMKDWAQGGEEALAWTLSLNGSSTYDENKLNWASSYKFTFGQTKLGDQGIRKTDDRIDLESVLTYKMGTYVNPYVSATLKSQFAKGYNYGAKPKVALSQFFDPAYLTQSAGVGYQPIPEVKTRLGLAVREIITRDFNSFSDDEETAKIEKSKVDGGLESVTDASWQMAENLLLTSKLEIFAPLAAIDETVVRSDNTAAVKVNKYVTVNLNVQIVNDDSASDKTQIKEALALGLSYNFL
jgi:hypothetical protein